MFIHHEWRCTIGGRIWCSGYTWRRKVSPTNIPRWLQALMSPSSRIPSVPIVNQTVKMALAAFARSRLKSKSITIEKVLEDATSFNVAFRDRKRTKSAKVDTCNRTEPCASTLTDSQVKLLSEEECSRRSLDKENYVFLEFPVCEARDGFVYAKAEFLRCFAISEKYDYTSDCDHKTTILKIGFVGSECSECDLAHALRAAGIVTRVAIDRSSETSFVEISHYSSLERKKTNDELEQIRSQVKLQSLLSRKTVTSTAPRSGWKSGSKRSQGGTSTAFREWLQETYGREFLNSGTGILDVAGGKGELAFKLLNYGGIRTTIVDPRPYNVVRMLKYLSKDHVLRLRHHALTALKCESKSQPLCIKVVVPLPDHIRCWFVYSPNQSEKLLASISKSTDYASETLSSSLSEEERLRRNMNSCSLVCGFHPDQATEAIVDWALDAKKPFAVVPCCVFPKLFTHRSHIKSHSAFCKFLAQKNSKLIRQSELPFPGRNAVIYTE